MCYPSRAVPYFLLEAKLLGQHDYSPFTDDGETQRLHGGQGQESRTELGFHPGRSDFNCDHGLPPAACSLSWDRYPGKLHYTHMIPDGLPSSDVLLPRAEREGEAAE